MHECQKIVSVIIIIMFSTDSLQCRAAICRHVDVGGRRNDDLSEGKMEDAVRSVFRPGEHRDRVGSVERWN